MDEKNYDGMIITNFNNIKYVSNYSPTSFAVGILKENPIVFTTAMDKELATETSLIEVKEFKSISDLKEVFKNENLKKIAIEGNLPIDYYKKLEGDKSKNEKWDLSIENFLEKERMVKSNKEIKNIKEATNIAHRSFEELDIREKREQSATDWEVAYELGYLMRSNGASEESFETIVATGSNSSLPHARLENKKLENIILMDWGSKYKGYCSDTSRTMIDEKNKKQKEIFDIVLEAHNKAIKSVRSGVKACDIDNMARSIISEYGYGENFIHSTGHSLGLDIHESPSISKKDETLLEKNMIVTIEPGIYLEGEFGVRIEDTVIVGKRNSEIIGKLPYNI
jgi:Xaa-Pro aminopeptidase